VIPKWTTLGKRTSRIVGKNAYIIQEGQVYSK